MSLLYKGVPAALALAVSLCVSTARSARAPQRENNPPQSLSKPAPNKQSPTAKPPTPDEELRQSIDSAGNDRADHQDHGRNRCP